MTIGDVRLGNTIEPSPCVFDHVIIETHATPEAIGDNKYWKLQLYEFDKLDEKDIQGNVVLLGCNAGHLDYSSNNVATHFAQKSNGALVIASDGTVNPRLENKSIRGQDGTTIQTPNGCYKSSYQRNSKTYVDPFKYFLINGERDNEGWIVYKYNGSNVTWRIADSGSKILTISGACQLTY